MGKLAVWLGLQANEPDDTAHALRRRYHNRIRRYRKFVDHDTEAFLKYDIESLGLGAGLEKDDGLVQLFEWGQTMFRERNVLEQKLEQNRRQCGHLSQRVDAHSKEIEGLRNELQSRQAELEQARKTHEMEVQKHAADCGNLEKEHENRVRRLEEQHGEHVQWLALNHANRVKDYDNQVEKLALDNANREREHKSEVQQLNLAHSNREEELKRQHDLRIQQLVASHARAAKELEDEKLHLQAQLLSPPDKSSAWADEKLRVKFRELCRLIDNATATIATTVSISPQGFSHSLDPDGSLRLVEGRLHFWLRSRIWAVLRNGFFALPFGFGAFGQGEGEAEILAVYRAWRSRLGDPARSEPPEEDRFSIFHRDEMANRWRSATFQSLAAPVAGGGSSSSSSSSQRRAGLVLLGDKNVARVAEQTMSMLSPIAASSPRFGAVGAQIRLAAGLAFELALQFGINPARLVLLSTERGATVTISKRQGFVDCEDGEERLGAAVRVALAISPGLQRIGDGRLETSQAHTIVPCEVFTSLQ